MYKSKLALPLLELAACLPAAVLLLATLVSHAMGPLLSASADSVRPSPWARGPALRAPLVLRTAMRAAERRAFCFSNASSRSSRASMRAAALVVLLLDEDEDVVRRSWVVMCGRDLLRDAEVCCCWRSWRGGGERISFGGTGSSFVFESVGEGRLEFGFCFLMTSEPDTGGVGGRARFGGGEGRGGVVSFLLLDLEISGVLGREMVAMLPLLRRFAAVRDIETDRGRGAYLLPSPRNMSFVGFGVDLALGKGTSSATSITGLKVMFAEFGLPLDAVGE
jgi:hypothetical protein